MNSSLKIIMNKLKEQKMNEEEAKTLLTDLKQIQNNTDVAIIGMSGQFPDAPDVEVLWQHMMSGHTSVRQLPDAYMQTEYDKTYLWGGILEERACFDPLFFKIAPKEAESMNPHQRLVLQESYKALEDSGYNPKWLKNEKVGLFIGAEPTGYLDESFTGYSDALIASRLAYHLDLKGPAMVVNTGCSSSAVALQLAYESVLNDESTIAIAGGVSALLDQKILGRLATTGMLSLTGEVHAFDEAADGTVISEGVGIVVLKRLEHAKKDGDHIYGVIKGVGIGQDGTSNGITAPNGHAQEQVIRDTYKKYHIQPSEISYIETHGTGTKLGDPIEVNALIRAFESFTSKKQYCALGSIKSYIGHTSAASGVIGLIKILLSIKYGKIPGQTNLKKINPLIDIDDTPFMIHRETMDWQQEDGKPLMAALNSFGHSGTNVHMVIQEYQEEEKIEKQESQINYFPYSARTKEQLKQILSKHLKVIGKKTESSLDISSWVKAQLCSTLHIQEKEILDNDALEDFGLDQLQQELLLKEIERKYQYHLTVLDLQTIGTIEQLSQAIAKHTHDDKYTPACLEDMAYTLQVGREALGTRVIFVASTREQLSQQIEAYLSGEQSYVGMWSGYYKAKKKEEKIELDTIKEWHQKGKYELVAEAWIHGTFSDWNVFYEKHHPRRISLPTYEFAKEHYWKKEAYQLAPNTNHTLSLVLTGRELYLKDHVLEGERILPGAAYLSMVLHAIQQVVPQNIATYRMSQIGFLAPMIHHDKEIPIHINLKEHKKNEWKYEVISEDYITQQSMIHSQGMIHIGESFKAEPINLSEVRRSCTYKALSHEEFYQLYTLQNVKYGPSHQGISKVFMGKDSLLASLQMPTQDEDKQNSFSMHPGLLDSIFQTTFLFDYMRLCETNQNITHLEKRVPFAVEECIQYKPFPSQCYVVVKERSAEQSARGILKYDMHVCDEDGNIVMCITGFTMKKIVSQMDELVLLQPKWREIVNEPIQELAYEDKYALCIHDEATEIEAFPQDWKVTNIVYPTQQSVEANFTQIAQTVFLKIKEILQMKYKKKVLVQVIFPNQGEMICLEGLGGMLRTLRLENPNCIGQLIQVDIGEVKGDFTRASSEMMYYPDYESISYHQKQAHYLAWDEYKSEQIEMPFKEDGVYLITGGTGKIAQIFVKDMIKRVKHLTLILVGRTPMNATIQEMMNNFQGEATIRYEQLDITDAKACEDFIEKIKAQYHQLNGILHTAGIHKDNFMIRKGIEEFEAVLAPKVKGVYNLDKATKDLNLDFMVYFASGSGAVGNIGQSDYATGNAFIDAYARYRNALVDKHQRSGKTYAIDWPLWENGGMQVDVHTAQRLEDELGMKAMSDHKGMEAFYRIMDSKQPQIYTVYGNRKKILEHLMLQSKVKEKVQASSQMDGETLTMHAQNYLKALLSDTIQLPAERIDVDEPLETYGIDSILILNMTKELERVFGLLPKTLFFEYQNIAELTEYFIENYQEDLFNLLKLSHEMKADERPIETKTFSEVANEVENEIVPDDNNNKIAIIGMAGRYPGGDNCEMLWETLKEGKDCISEVPKERWNHNEYYDEDKDKEGKTYAKWGGFIRNIEQFDPKFFNITPYEAELLDPQERLFLQCVYHTIEDAGYTRQQLSQKGSSHEYRNVGVYVGVMYEEYQLYGAQEMLKGNPIALGGSQASIANRVSYYFDFHGPSMAVDSMCSSSLTAVSLACQSILNGTCDTAIAGGVNLTLHPNKYFILSQGRFASSKGRCESFGQDGDGYVPGEGVGAILMKPLDKAIKDGDHIYGVIRSAVINHGGKTNGYSVPNPNAQAHVIHEALKQAKINPRMINYIEAHGTGTALGDPIEILGLKKAFEHYTKDKAFCAIGSIKSNIGHCEGAAGIAAITKVLLQLKHQTLVPSIHSDVLNENIDFGDSPFYVQHQVEAWQQPTMIEDSKLVSGNRCAGISSFGAGGSNAHMIIEEYCEPARAESNSNQEELIVLSAKTQTSLKQAARQLIAHIEKYKTSLRLEDVAYTLKVGREQMKYRMSIICHTLDELQVKLKTYVLDTYEDGVYWGESSQESKKEKILAAEKTLEQVAKAFAKGNEIDWSQENDNKNLKRISLPGYCFDESIYWYQKGAQKFISKLYPLIGSNESNFESQHYKVVLDGSEVYLKDHVVYGKKTFPAAAYIEMVREAVELSFALKEKTNVGVYLKQVSFNQPLYIDHINKTLEIELYRNEKGSVDFEIYERVGEHQEKVYCQGQVTIKSLIELPSVDVPALIQKHQGKKLDKASCYEMYNQLGIQYGMGMQCVNEVLCGKDSLLAHLLNKEQGEGFILSPALIDSGLQSLIGFEENQKELSLPYAMESIEIWKNLEESMWVYIERNNKKSHLEAFDLTFLNEQGKACMKIHQFISRKKQRTTVQATQALLDTHEIYEDYFKDIVAVVTKLPNHQIDVLESFDDLGIDSVMVMKMTSQLENTFGLLPKTLFFEYKNIKQLTEYFVETFKEDLDRITGADKHQSSSKVQTAHIQDEQPQEMITMHKLRQSKYVQQDIAPMNDEREQQEIAIIGLAGSYPMADNLMEFWTNLREGKDCITTVPKKRWDFEPIFDADKDQEKHIYTKWGGFLKDVETFDSLFFKISPREAELMDPQERLFLTCAYEAIEDAGYTNWLMNQQQASQNVGVYVGVMYEEYQFYGIEEQVKGNMIALQGNTSSIANRVSYYFNLTGPSMAVNTMCSSSLTSIHLACQSILNHECDMALAGGVNLNLHRNKYLLISDGKFASTTGKCKSFGKEGDGYVPGEGVGAVLLKPLHKAIADGDHIYGVIKGTSLNHSGKTNGYTVPSPNAQAQVIHRAFERAHVNPATISYVEAHGTGTALGDPIEIEGLMKVFEPYTQEKQFCAIGSVKSNIGHCEGAAGIAALTKVLLQMKYQTLVPSLHSEVLNPNIDFKNTPFKVQQTAEEWKQPYSNNEEAYPRRACISSFGAGGSNAHIIMEEYVESKDISQHTGPYIVLLTAKNKAQLNQVVRKLYTYIQIHELSEEVLSNMAYTLQVGRYHMEERLALIIENMQHLEAQLEQYLNHEKKINHLYQGTVKKLKDSVLMSNQDEDMDQMIKSWMNKGKLSKLIALWIEGFEIDWRYLYQDNVPRRMSLPTYSFEKERYWIPKTTASQAALQKREERSLENQMAHIIDTVINDKNDIENAIQSIKELI